MSRMSVMSALFAVAGLCVHAQEELLLQERVQRDCAAVRATVDRMEERPTREALMRIIDWAKRHPDDPESLYCAGAAVIAGWLNKGEIDPIDFLKRAAEKGHPAAMAAYGIELCTGEHVKKDTASGLALLRKSAARGELQAYYHLGTVYETGMDTAPRDLEKATAYYQIAVEKGMTRALGQLARVLQKRGDNERAMEYAHKGAEAGDWRLMEFLVFLHDARGEHQKAASWLERGASRGSVSCMRDLATWLDGEMGGLKRDPVRSRGLLERAAELGDRNAIVLVEVGRATGRFGVPVDKERGLQSLRRMAADGWMEAQFELGALLTEGEYVPRDLEQAKALLEKAWAQGHGPAERALKVIESKRTRGELK